MNSRMLAVVAAISLTTAAPAAAKRGHPPSRACCGERFGEARISIFVQRGQASQHQGHQTPAQLTQPETACAHGAQQALAFVDAAASRLETARQTNSATDMRAAMADLQSALDAIRTQLTPCRTAAPPPASGHEHHSPAAPGTPVTQPGSTTPAPGAVRQAAADAIDPVCATRVDPKTAPKAEYEGKTYYFCSESDRQLFVKNPAKYAKKE